MHSHGRTPQTMGEFLGTTAQQSPSGFSFNVTSHSQLEAFSMRRDIPAVYTVPAGSAAHLKASGVRSSSLWISSTVTESGFEARSKVSLDVLSIRFVMAGHLARQGALERIDCPRGHGVLTVHADAPDFVAGASTQMLGVALDLKNLRTIHESLEDPLDYQPDNFRSVASIKSPRMRNCVQLTAIMMHWLNSGIQPRDLIYPLVEDALILQILTSWPRKMQDDRRISAPSARGLKMALDYIEANLANPITVSDIARASGIGIRSLQNAFKQELGCSPISHVLGLRLDKVRAELMADGGTQYISQVAHKWGFRHLGDFTARYKARFGVTPKEDRRR